MLLIGNIAWGQDIPLSQYYSNSIQLNPAFAGIRPNHRVNLFYRNQWPTAESGFKSYGASFDTRAESLSGGLGVILSNEVAGVNLSPSIDFIYSYGFELFPRFYVSVAMQVGFVQRYQNSREYNFEEDEFMQYGFTKFYMDFALGSVFFYNNLYGGIAVDHIAKPYLNEDNIFGGSDIEDSRLNRKLTVHLGYLKYLNTRLIKQQRVLSPNILIQWQGLQQNITWGSSFQYDQLIGGLWIRNNIRPNFDALIFSFGIKTKTYRIAYSYDMNIGKKVSMPVGAHEISFTMLVHKNKTKKYSGIKTPTFLQ